MSFEEKERSGYDLSYRLVTSSSDVTSPPTRTAMPAESLEDGSVEPSPPGLRNLCQSLTRRTKGTKRRLAGFALSVPLTFLVPYTILPSTAHAESAWWGLSSQPRPTYLQPGKTNGVAGQNEVQEITAAESAAFELKAGSTFVGDFETSPYPFGFLAHATAENIQEALEQVYGKGNVEVAGGPGGQASLIVTSVNGDADQKVAMLEVVPILGTAEAKVAMEGKAAVGSGQTIVVTATNLGDAQVSGAKVPVTISDQLPKGVEAYEIQAYATGRWNGLGDRALPLACSVTKVSCTFDGALAPYGVIEMFVAVNVEETAEPGASEVNVSGGQTGECKEVGAGEGTFLGPDCLDRPFSLQKPGSFDLVPVAESTVRSTSLAQQLTVSNTPTPFGVEHYEMKPEAEGGGTYTQAGGHPFQLTTTIAFNAGLEEVAVPGRGAGGPGGQFFVEQPAMPKNIITRLPQGLVGNPSAIPQCTEQQFEGEAEYDDSANLCPPDSAVGVAVVQISILSLAAGTWDVAVPIFNLVPEHGEPARFGFSVDKTPVILDASVRTGGDYGVTITSDETNQTVAFLWGSFTFWGAPGAAAHRLSRGNDCVLESDNKPGEQLDTICAKLEQPGGRPLLTMSTTCATEPLFSEMDSDTWASLGVSSESLKEPMKDEFPTMTGCNGLNFEPTIKTTPDYEEASRPSGLSVNVHVPQDAGLNPSGVAGSEVKRVEVTLPEGVTVNPGGAGGLQACSLKQIGFKGPNPEAVGGLEFTSSAPECPKQSKIATVTIHTPLLPNPLEGAVYLATPAPFGELNANPFNSLIAMYLVAEDLVSGTLVKLPMQVELNQTTGQITTTVANPQLPFEDAELHFFGGGRAPLATPGLCGSYTTKAVFTPWSGQEPVTSTSTFNITSGPNGSPCPSNPRPFTPEFQAGSTNVEAGAYSELHTTMGHPDVDQPLGALSMKMPPGLMGSLAGVKLCPEAQANAGTCGPESLIGQTVVTAGLGSTPAVVKRPGRVYITEKYEGAPFGLSIVTPAETGPFNLGEVVVRAKIEVDPHTAQLTITTNPPGTPDAIPSMLKGIPLDLQHVGVQIDRPNFMFNPTSCAPMKIEGTMASSGSASVPVSTPFQVSDCARLPFKPGFKAATKAHHTRKDGAKLEVKVTSSKGQANIAKVHVELPKKLPSELKTLQKACTEAQFNANPAGCPEDSDVGSVLVHTPVLPVPLTGAAYFVSRGTKWPDLIMVLQGYGITVDLAGETHISKNGITSTTFSSVPDVPFTNFKLTLPEGPHSALAGNGNLCYRTTTKRVKKKIEGKTIYRRRHVKKRITLTMPTTITGQNGAVVKQNTTLSVTNCGTKPKAKTRR